MPGQPGKSSSSSAGASASSNDKVPARTSILFDKGTVKEAIAVLNERSQGRSSFGPPQVPGKTPSPPGDSATQATSPGGDAAAGARNSILSSSVYGACADAEATSSSATVSESNVEHSASAGLQWLLSGKCCHRRRGEGRPLSEQQSQPV
mmetsp:Transcript_11348/g.26166  ORF Transcript_11348/g.26166 Transcript_11348/m.26166 type:complete len:150 (-) Transcript_11348:67-516(-)|eukprot:CAMPEP_0178428912 /NCGR_PEP_ID=MMETSP0689_2-20121128/30528_1 /TAXON_ID=160604 /ORGANISM="Amphidinium massartii, Strain CS-259" /LENGTH=149 /DNA_ID=CAMNT_0020050711 /DNA_START=55 /DNA_END=500 /DNA_ORIENTATION=-